MGDSLYDWCMDKKVEHPELTFNCDDLKDGSEEEQEDLLTKILRESVMEKVKNDDNALDKDIVEKRKLIADLKELITSKNYDTHERRHQELQKIASRYYTNLISYIVLLVVAILMAIVLIYYFFIYRKK